MSYEEIQMDGVLYKITHNDAGCVVKRDHTVIFEYSLNDKTFNFYPNFVGNGDLFTVSIEDGCACINHEEESYELTTDSSLVELFTTGKFGRCVYKTYYDMADVVIQHLIGEGYETDAFEKQMAERKMDDIVHIFDLDLSIKMNFEKGNFLKVKTYMIAGVRNTVEGVSLSWQSPVDGEIADEMDCVEAINTIIFYFPPENKRAILARYEIEEGAAIMNTRALKEIRKLATLFYCSHTQEGTL